MSRTETLQQAQARADRAERQADALVEQLRQSINTVRRLEATPRCSPTLIVGPDDDITTTRGVCPLCQIEYNDTSRQFLVKPATTRALCFGHAEEIGIIVERIRD